MAKRGRGNHMKRIAAPKAVPIHDKKAHTWMARAKPGPHSTKMAIPLSVLIRDVLGLADTLFEVKKILNARRVLVDGKARTEPSYPVGLMDVVSIPDAKLHYQITVSRGKLQPRKIDEKEAGHKFLKVVGKRTVAGGRQSIRFHDGRSLPGDNHMKIGDSAIFSFKDGKIEKLLKRGVGAKCLVVSGKHAGKEAKIEKFFEGKEGRPTEVMVKTPEGEVRTLLDYLFIIGDA
ncbi:MAG TPA: S4 domain-containing protein [Candidatus Bilamarchaeaceae archaeon]|nr:S4 domain-containing protein [Candidatus Bilamarchaeaceae archaeon]